MKLIFCPNLLKILVSIKWIYWKTLSNGWLQNGSSGENGYASDGLI
jgi:hypothetical protein